MGGSSTDRGRSRVGRSTRVWCRRWGRQATATTTDRWCLNRKRWNTRLELANAICDYLEVFHNWQRRHSSFGILSPIEFERRHADNLTRDQASSPRKPGAHQGDSTDEVEVCVAPTPVLVTTSGANLVHAVVAALDLSTTGRGREILQSWTKPIAGRPVWL